MAGKTMIGQAMAVMLALVLGAGALLAHGKGRLKLASQHLVAGGTVELTGSEFAKKEAFNILLVGASGRTKLGEVRSDGDGKFAITVTVPPTAKPGSYRVVIEAADDDDEVANADAMVMAGGSSAKVAEHDMSQHEGMDMPSREPLKLDRARSQIVTGGAITAIMLAFAIGGVLLRRNGRM